MTQTTFSVRMEKELKEQFDSLCKEFGMNTTTAINVFARAVVRQRRIPFEINSPKADITRESALEAFYSLGEHAEKNGLSDMTLEDINKEIEAVRKRK